MSITELDFIVQASQVFKFNNIVYGARLMGAAFGGGVLVLLRSSAVDAYREAISASFRNEFGSSPGFYHLHPSDGARVLKV